MRAYEAGRLGVRGRPVKAVRPAGATGTALLGGKGGAATSRGGVQLAGDRCWMVVQQVSGINLARVRY